jgi:hypothetical protein
MPLSARTLYKTDLQLRASTLWLWRAFGVIVKMIADDVQDVDILFYEEVQCSIFLS